MEKISLTDKEKDLIKKTIHICCDLFFENVKQLKNYNEILDTSVQSMFVIVMDELKL